MAQKPKQKEKRFLQTPEYPGGKQALKAFINAHLQYPQDAQDQGIEGIVSVGYEVNDEGKIVSAKIIKGLTPSCNEEALRIVHLLQYAPAHNHGMRVTTKKKVNIRFKRAARKIEQTVLYSVAEKKKTNNSPEKSPEKPQENYSYTIVF